MLCFFPLSRFCGESDSAKLGFYYPAVFLRDKADLTLYPTSVLLVAVDNYCFGVYVSGGSHMNSIWVGCLIFSYGVDSRVH
jgi:hypothetical protein